MLVLRLICGNGLATKSAKMTKKKFGGPPTEKIMLISLPEWFQIGHAKVLVCLVCFE